MIKVIWYRIISDYFLKNRIKEYEEFILLALKNNYAVIPHSEFFRLAKLNQLEGKKILMIRHDIDSDPKYCKQWLSIEKKLGIKTSYYFRRCTFDVEIMKLVEKSGSDCGYHYEEIADYAKQHKLKNRKDVEKEMIKIQKLFIKNIHDFQNKLGFKIKNIASHGDFVNKKLKMFNHELVNQDLLLQNGIDFECYQKEFVENYSLNISDCSYPLMFKNNVSPQLAIEQSLPIIHVLIHPRHWRKSWKWNTYENIKRLIEGLKYKFL